ncbi:SET domain-containing protein [Ramaria rubella]|nr:SET domain-containing protein [Ramaria rubella]
MYNNLPPSLEIRQGSIKGRGIWSKQAFRKGNVLLTLQPHVSVLSTPNLPDHCSLCASRSQNKNSLKRCTKCKTIWYCSSTCQNSDWSIHKLECPAIVKWKSSAPDGSPPGEAVRSLGRILWGRKVHGENSLWWEEVQALQSHRSSLSLSTTESHSQLGHALVRYLGVESPVELEPYGLHSIGDLVDIISRFTTNTFTLTSPTLTPLGTCVSPIAALFNHSCLPNAVIVFPRPKMQASTAPQEPVLHVIAIKDVLAGEEVLTAYIDTSLPTSQRQHALKETYNFTCQCPLCSSTKADSREILWCPKICGGMCLAPFDQELTEFTPRCTTCNEAFTQSALQDIEDKRRIGQEALDKATFLQFSGGSFSSICTHFSFNIFSSSPSSHPLLALLRLQQSLLITSFSTSTTFDGTFLNDTIRTTARAVSGLTAILDEGHPVRAVALAELGKLLAVDEPASHDLPPASQSNIFPPSGVGRLRLAIETLKRALQELIIGFGDNTGGGEVGYELREMLISLEREMGVWNRGVKNARENMPPLLGNNKASS